jgi:lactoylglutathione lyase
MHKLFILLFTLCFSVMTKAQDTVNYRFSFNHLALSVKDVNRSADFYTSVLHLKEIVNRTKKEGIRWMSMGEGNELHLISTTPGEVKITKAVHLALTTPRFNDFIKELQQKKVSFSDWPGESGKITVRPDNILQIYLQDPDGYWIEVNSVAQQ